MIPGYHPVVQGLLGTLVTWGLTAAGAFLVFFLDVDNQQLNRKILDAMLGFAAGVMIAASFWSLLAPGLEIAEASGTYGDWAFLPVAIGFAAGGVMMQITEKALPYLGIKDSTTEIVSEQKYIAHKKNDDDESTVRQRKGKGGKGQSEGKGDTVDADSWRRTILLVIAITLHNFPEGLAVGVAFGGVGKPGATFEAARNLAIGVGLQNFPEGLAVSMPLRREKMSLWKSFFYGQLSGMVEPLGGVIGAWAVHSVEPMLPYALGFAAGAMIYVVVDDLVPEAHESGNKKLATTGCMIGFIVMMVMDVALG